MSDAKKCTKCGEVKAIDAFGSDGARLRSRCLKCKAAAKAAYRAANPDPKKYARQKAVWRAANPEKHKGYADTWRSRLSEGYVAGLLHARVADCPLELIELKREQIQIHRLTKQLNQAIREIQK